ncbi:hypothetical protein AAGG74_18705 [Bacillus mexicanus]|uniref:hypothetical protein n=1 Tax=Bacillus mexicanus TaxID=2834415 RepID=UPI003D246D8A
MIHIQKGDLLDRNNGCHFILHQANCEKVMGKGIAEKIAKMYPKVKEVDRDFPDELGDRLGKYSIAKIEDEFYIVNLYGQLYRGKPKSKKELEDRYKHFQKSLSSFLSDLHKKQRIEEKQYKIGLPYKIASDMAGADWVKILEILIDVSEKCNIQLFIYKI